MTSTHSGGAQLVYPSGVELFNQGQMLEAVFLLVNGMIKLTHIDGDGRASLIGFAMSSDWLGSAAVVSNQPASTSAITCTKSVLYRYPAATFRRRLFEEHQFSKTIHEAHAQELCRQAKWIGELGSHDARARLASVLVQFALTLAGRNKSRVRMQLPIRHWELAEFIGVTPEHLSRVFRDLERDGAITREKGWIVLTNVQRLAEESARQRARWLGEVAAEQ